MENREDLRSEMFAHVECQFVASFGNKHPLRKRAEMTSRHKTTLPSPIAVIRNARHLRAGRCLRYL